jgi:RNA recognition motif-containing protein
MEESSANAAIKSLDNQLVDGRELKVNEAKPKTSNGGGGNRNRSNKNRW